MDKATKEKINRIARAMAKKYSDNPTQAAFIFDRMFCLDGQRCELTVLADDFNDGGALLGDVKEIHQMHLNLDATSQNQIRKHAITLFELAFMEPEDSDIDFKETLEKLNQGKIQNITLNRVTGRLTKENIQQEMVVKVVVPQGASQGTMDMARRLAEWSAAQTRASNSGLFSTGSSSTSTKIVITEDPNLRVSKTY